MHYGKRLTELIEWKGVDKKALALGIGVHRSRLIRQLKNPFPDMKIALDALDFIGLPAEALFSERDFTPIEAGIMQEVKRLSVEQQKALLELLRVM